MKLGRDVPRVKISAKFIYGRPSLKFVHGERAGVFSERRHSNCTCFEQGQWALWYTVECLCNTVQYDIIFPMTLSWVKQNINQECQITNYIPYLALTGELWGVFCEDLVETWQRYNDTAIYKAFFIFRCWTMSEDIGTPVKMSATDRPPPNTEGAAASGKKKKNSQKKGKKENASSQGADQSHGG